MLETNAAPSNPAATSIIPGWKTITIGTHKTVADLAQALASNGFLIDTYTADILQKIPLATTQTEIELVLVTAADLGLGVFPRGDAIYNRAKKLGLELVPAEVGPQLRLQYSDQPAGELLLMAMEPIADSDGNRSVFYITHDDNGPRLDSNYGAPSSVWNPDRRWVFRRK